ncbi:MAG: hypothetical protein EBX40_06690 [Gammaproteobacteria bacterium]|nr:hypothetical protein [Gammaproteobacteria bacterium]
MDPDCDTSFDTFPINFDCGPGYISPEGPEFCFERIKLFDELPEDGDFQFTNADDGSQCSDFPTCARIDFETEVCFLADCGDRNPCWCDFTIEDVGADEFGNPPRVYKSGGDTITSYTGPCSGDCIENVYNCNNNPTTCPEVAQVLPCEKVVFDCNGIYCTAGTVNGDYISLPAFGLFDNPLIGAGQVCPTGTPLFGSPFEPLCDFSELTECYSPTICTVEDCGDCCEFKDCGECSQCFQNVSAPYIWTQEIEVETTCDDVRTGQICCVDYQPVTLSIVFS